MLPFKKILWPTDFSEASYAALEPAKELAEHFSAELCILHVVAPIPTATVPAPVAPATFNVPMYQKELQESSEKTLRELVEQKFPKGMRIRALVKQGSAAYEIVQVAGDEGVNLIVIATHGQTGWRRIMFGSVAEKVVRMARTAVLTVPAPSREE
ncbi:MAG: universal stress protein [Candidatus Abyssubacteria bacterium]